jgi:hypothetical protein
MFEILVEVSTMEVLYISMRKASLQIKVEEKIIPKISYTQIAYRDT